jgi:DNA-binding CsgD family transcriptional regulator
MLNSFSPAQLISKILKLQNGIYDTEVGKKIVLNDNYLNEFSDSEKSVKLVFDHINFRFLSISQNVESLSGHSVQAFKEFNMLYVLNLFTFDHCDFIYVWLKWIIKLHQKFGKEKHFRESEAGLKINSARVSLKQSICGVKLKHKDGHVIRIMLRHYPLETMENGIATVAAITIDDISHLMKSDFYWGRIERVTEDNEIYHIKSSDTEDKLGDIFSNREKDILRMLAQGKESKEIAAITFISSHTVDNHRRNMINKIGVRDTTGLVQICRMMGVI